MAEKVRKPSKPLRVLIHPGLLDSRPVQELLVAPGHTVHTEPEGSIWDYDLILGPLAWRMTALHLTYLEDAIQEARKRRYTVGKGEAVSG